MKKLEYMPIGTVKITPARYWQCRTIKLKAAMKVMFLVAFILGMICGAFIGLHV